VRALLQAMQLPQLEVPQQTLSTQNPEAQSVPVPQV